MGLSQWPSDLVLHFNHLKKKKKNYVHPCLHVSIPSWWVYHARAPSQCVSNYMFLLEAPVSCVASPFVSVGQTGLQPAITEAKHQPRPLRRSIITVPVQIYGKPLSC